MDEATILLTLRFGAAALLLLFVSTILLLLWRDYIITTREIEQQRIPRGKLVVLASDNDAIALDTEYPLLPLTIIGRSPTNTVYLADSFASNEHAILTYRGGNWWLEDRNSSNGTYLNGSRINEPVIVSSGDLIGVGRVTLRMQLD